MSGPGKERAALLHALHEAMRSFTNQVTFYSEAVAATVGIHPTDLDCLSVIDMEGSMTAGRLADVTGLTTGAVTGVIDRLERAGYVRREADPTDRRRVVVVPVAESLGPVGSAFVPMIAATSTMASRYTDAELATITDYVTRSTPMLREETLRLRDRTAEADGALDEDEVALSGMGIRDATLRFVNGAVRLAVAASHDQTELFSGRFRGGTPTTREDGDDVVVQYRRSPFAHFRTSGDITLAADRRWSVQVKGGLAHCRFDLRATVVDRIDVIGGAASVELHLPRPDRDTSVRVVGGVSAVTVTRPADVHARIRIEGGATNLVLDDQRLRAVGGVVRLASPRPSDGLALEVVVVGGARSLSVVTAP